MTSKDIKKHLVSLCNPQDKVTAGEWSRTHKFRYDPIAQPQKGDPIILAHLQSYNLQQKCWIRQYVLGRVTPKLVVAIVVTDDSDTTILHTVFAELNQANW